MTKKIPSFSKIERKLRQLIYLADINFQVCKEVMDAKNPDSFLLLAGNNAFDKAVINLHTLLASGIEKELRIGSALEEKIEREKRLFKENELMTYYEKGQKVMKILEKYYPKENYEEIIAVFDFEKDYQIGDEWKKARMAMRIKSGIKDLEKLKNDFENNKFHIIRHNISAHRNNKTEGIGGSVSQKLKGHYVSNLGDMVKKTRVFGHFWFDNEMENPYVKVLDSLKKYIK